MVENVIIYLVNAHVRLDSRDHCVLMFVRWEHMVKRVNQSVNVKMMVFAIHKPENVSVQMVGLVKCAQIGVPADFLAKTVNSSVNAITTHTVIISPVNVNVQPALLGQNALIPVLVICTA